MKSKKLSFIETRDLLEENFLLYNQPSFIASDPISIPHLYSKKQDIEIAGFLAATIAWGNRSSILTNAKRIMQLMNNSPHEFVLNFTETQASFSSLKNFVHRTFNGEDLIYFILALQHIYRENKDMESFFVKGYNKTDSDLKQAIAHFRNTFFELEHPKRTQKHVADTAKNSAAKRINLFLRWMVRKDTKGVDFGLWNKIPAAVLSCPLDVHSGTVARKLGLLQRTQNDWKACAELTSNLKLFDANDPVKYDFALFGLGVNKALNINT